MRRRIQIIWLFLTNGYWLFLGKNKLYTGILKGICAPGLNCYSCPAATLGCPIGGIQSFLSTIRPNWRNSFHLLGMYIIGTLTLVGSLIGRMPCGWACPFGLFQEILYKIPSPKFKLSKPWLYLKYGVLAFFVFLLPLVVVDKLGYGQNWFCRYLCPAGTLEAGLPLLALMPGLRQQIGWLFFHKLTILIVFLWLMIFYKRPFCRLLCPLGALYGIFNKISLFKLNVDKDKCILCNLCYKHCPMDIKIYEGANQLECIRCLDCKEICPVEAISATFGNNHTSPSKGTSHSGVYVPGK